MNKDSSLASLILRIGAGGMFLTHGWPKFQKVLAGNFSFADPIGIGEAPTLMFAVIAEFICPILLIVGFKTKWVAMPPAITMFAVAFVHHADDPWKKQEFPLLYLLCFVVIFLLGSGKYSLDMKLASRR